MTLDRSLPIHTRGWVLPAVVALAGLSGLAVAPVGVDGPTLCPFALMTGHACPGCGLTRALVALVHGDLAASLAYHPLAPLIGAEIALALALWAARRSGRFRSTQVPAAVRVLAVTGVALVAVWVVRLASGTLPPV